MVEIIMQNNQLLLAYTSDRVSATWVDEKLKRDGDITIRRTFTFSVSDVLDNSENEVEKEDIRMFLLGTEHGRYFKIDKKVLSLKYDLLLSKEMRLTHRSFVANRDISVFRRIDDLVDEPIIVGGETEGSIPVTDFEKLLKNFPTSAEITHYANSRITRILKDYFVTISDAEKKLNRYRRHRQTIGTSSGMSHFKEYEIAKYEYIRDELKEMLKSSESYTERDWQKKIIVFLLLLFPKYVAVLENLQIKDFYHDQIKPKDRYIDLTFVDANGTIDILEIKQPFSNCILSSSKYRENYIPRKELSGAVMQVEKYIFHLNKWGREGERIITEKRKNQLPPEFEVKITNPKAMIVLGRDADFASDQKFDFEIIKRKYSNIIDIMTYDDLLRRLNNTISMFQHASI